MSVTIFHNARCSTSRKTMDLLRERGVEPAVRLYLEDAPTLDELRTLVAKLGIPAQNLLRRKEAIYAELTAKEGGPDHERALAWMAVHPILIERPIVINGDRARIGRPPESVLDIL